MNIEDELKYLIAGYLCIKEMDEYDLKVYVLEEVEKYIKSYIDENFTYSFNYKKRVESINDELSLKTKLQDSLLVLNKTNGPMELVYLIKKRLRKMK